MDLAGLSGPGAGKGVQFGVDQFAEAQGQSVGESVEDVAAGGLGLEYAAFDEFAQVFGDVGLGGTHVQDDFTHAARVLAEGLENSQAQGIG